MYTELCRACDIDGIHKLGLYCFSCTRASRFYLHVGDAVLHVDSVSPHLNHIEKIGTVAASDYGVVLKKEAKADENDTTQIQQFSFIKLTVLQIKKHFYTDMNGLPVDQTSPLGLN